MNNSEDFKTPGRLVAATLALVVPLALTMMPLEELLKRLLGILF